jgi:hypothetical protein
MSPVERLWNLWGKAVQRLNFVNYFQNWSFLSQGSAFEAAKSTGDRPWFCHLACLDPDFSHRVPAAAKSLYFLNPNF